MKYNKPNPLDKFSRRAIAEQYFESTSPEGAVKRMNRWLKDDPTLMNDLRAAGYHDRQRHFTRQQIDVFRKYFG